VNYLITPEQQLENLRKIMLWVPTEDRDTIISLMRKISDEINQENHQNEIVRKGALHEND
jgi:hypothetical protein